MHSFSKIGLPLKYLMMATHLLIPFLDTKAKRQDNLSSKIVQGLANEGQ